MSGFGGITLAGPYVFRPATSTLFQGTPKAAVKENRNPPNLPRLDIFHRSSTSSGSSQSKAD